MDSLGDLVYVIAIIAWIIYSFVSKGNKQKNQRKTVDETTARPEPGADIKKMLEELLGKTESAPPPPSYETRKPTIRPVYETRTEEGQSQEGKALNPVDNYEFGKYKSLETIVNDEAEVASQYERFNTADYREETAPHSIAEKEKRVEITTHEEEKESTIARDFDIEKAIIYSEILKRPAWAL